MTSPESIGAPEIAACQSVVNKDEIDGSTKSTKGDMEPPDRNDLEGEVNAQTFDKLDSARLAMNTNLKEMAARLNPKSEQVLKEMEDNVIQKELKDGTVQFECSYAFLESTDEAFPINMSNYETALKQAKVNYHKMKKNDEGRAAIN